MEKFFKHKEFHKELQGEDLNNDTFTACVFTSADMKFTRFKNCTFIECDFSSSNLDMTDFSHCSFSECKLSYLDFSGAGIEECSFTDCLMLSCSFYHLKPGDKTRKKKWNLSNCSFAHSDLTGAIYEHCILNNCNFEGSSLTKVVFEWCELENSFFERADLSGICFTECSIKKCVLDINGFISLGNARGFILK